MKKLLLLLMIVPFIGFGQDIGGTGWKIYEEDGTRKIILFEKDGTFTYMESQKQLYSDDTETWKLNGDKIIILYSDGYRILSGTINRERDYISGTSINREGYSESWYGELIKY